MNRTSPVPDVWFAVPGDLQTLTGGYAYARQLMKALPATGWFPHHLALPGGFPNPSAEALAETRAILAALPPETPVLADGLAYGALPRALLEDLELSLTALVHHPLAEETGLSEADVARFKDSERAALRLAQSVVATSGHTVESLARDYGVSRNHLYLAPPGTEPALRAPQINTVPKLLTVATLTHRKAHDVLIPALAGLIDLPWTSLLVGSQELDAEVTRKVQELIAVHKLGDRIALAGELKDAALDAAYTNADVFVLPSRHEGYGMVFTEALARGLPIVACAAGAVTDTVPADAGILVPPDDSKALAAALRRMLSDAPYRKQLSDAAWAHGQALPTWNETAALVAEALWNALP
jgi:glycosyltransferase involved in cell wall biosynthesis